MYLKGYTRKEGKNMTTKKRKGNHKVATYYLINSIVYHICEFVKENRVMIITASALALTWLGGFILGMSFAFGSMGGF